MRIKSPSATLALVSVLFTFPAYSADVCTALLAQGIRDTSSTQVTEARFNELKSNVCNSNYDSYSKSAAQALTGGFDMPGVFGISFGSATANSEYSTKWTNFYQASYALAISNVELKTYFSTANRAVLNSFDNCVNATTERFIRYVEPQADGGTYSVTFNNRRQGDATFQVIGVSLTNSSSGQVIKVLEACDVPEPFKHDFPWNTGGTWNGTPLHLNAFSIVCRRNANDRVVVAGTTTAGMIDPVVVQPIPTPGPTIGDRVAALEGVAQNLEHLVALVSTSGDVVISKTDLAAFQAAHKDNGTVWKLCNGDGGTLNMTGRYPRGAGPGIPAPGVTQEQSIQNHTHILAG